MAQNRETEQAASTRKWFIEVVNGRVDNPKAETVGPTRHVQYRLPLSEYLRVEALAEETGMSQASVLMTLCMIGLEEIDEDIDGEVREKVKARQLETIREMFPGVLE